MFKGIIKSFIIRLARRNFYKKDFDFYLKLYFDTWLTQGFNRRFLRNCKYEALFSIFSSYDYNNVWSFGFYKCKRNACIYCKHGIFNNVYFDNCNNVYRICKYLTCDTVNCIYLIYCNLCGLIYVGESSEPLRRRISSHIHNIRKSSDHPISKHFNNNNHNLSNFQFICIDSTPNSIVSRRNTECKYIIRLKPLINCLSSNIPKHMYSVFPYSHKTALLNSKLKSIITDCKIFTCFKRISPKLVDLLKKL